MPFPAVAGHQGRANAIFRCPHGLRAKKGIFRHPLAPNWRLAILRGSKHETLAFQKPSHTGRSDGLGNGHCRSPAQELWARRSADSPHFPRRENQHVSELHGLTTGDAKRPNRRSQQLLDTEGLKMSVVGTEIGAKPKATATGFSSTPDIPRNTAQDAIEYVYTNGGGKRATSRSGSIA